MKKKVLSALLSVAMVATMLVGCGAQEAAAPAPAATEEAAPADEAPAEEVAEEAAPAEDAAAGYEGTISYMHFSTSEEADGNGGSDATRSNAMTLDHDGNMVLSGDITNGNGLSLDGINSTIGDIGSILDRINRTEV